MSDHPITRAEWDRSYGGEEPEPASPFEGQPVRFFFVYEPPGTVVGAFYLGDQDPQLGFMPRDVAHPPERWVAHWGAARDFSPGDGREAFNYWSQAGNGVVFDVGPVGRAPSAIALRELLDKAAAEPA